MKTTVEKFKFIAKIARNVACLSAFFALSASADDVRTLGYATSGAAAALPAAPDMGGTVVNVTAAQAQYVLDGAYGSIDGKTINFTESVADTLVLGRASKYVGSGTLYRHGSHDGEAMSYADFIAYKNQATWTESCYYERTVENVTFTADAGVVVNFTAEGGAHVYAAEGETAPVYDYVRDTGEWVKTGSCFFKRAILKNITFKGLTFKAKTNFETSESTTVYDGFTFTGCTFEIGSTAAGNYALRYYSENNNGCVRNLVVENCTFRNCFQGIYTHHVKGITVKDSTFETTGHNAIAIQSTDGKGACDHGAVVITGNTFKNIGDRIIRFNAVGAGTTITIVDNTADGNSGKVVTGKREIVKAASLPENAAEIITASGNDWGANAVVGNDAFADTVKTEKALRKAFAEAPTDGTAVTVKLGADITLETLYAAENFGTETLADNAEGDTFNRYKIGVHPTAEDPSHWNPLVTSQTEAERVVYGAYYHSGATDERIARLVVKAGQKIVLDLNGHTIQKNARATHGDWLNVCTDIIGNYGTLEIVDSSEGAKGTVKGIGYKSCSGAVLHNYEGASMTVGAVNVDGNAAGMADETGQYVISNEGGTLVIDGANVFDTATSASLVMSASGTVTIRNATLSHPATKVINAKGGVIDIESASVTSEKYAIFATKDATVNVKGAVTITGAGTLHVEGDAATIAKMPDVELPAPDGFVWVAEGESQILKPVAATIGAVSYETLDAAIKAVQDGETIVVNAGEYKLTGSQSAYSGKAFTVKAAENAAVSFDMSAAVTLGGAKITFEGVTFDYKTNGDYIGLQHADTLVYNDCTINGVVFLYAASETFNRCTFNQSSGGAYNVWTYGAKKVAFNACTFNCAGKSVLVYNEGATEKTDLTVASCEFKATAEAAGKAAIEIDTSLMKDGASVAIDGQTTATGFATGSNSGSALWNDKKQTKDTNKNVTVTVAGETVFAPVAAKIGETGYASLAEALAAAKAGETVKLLADATEDVAVATSVTLDLGGKTLTNAGAGKVTLTIAEGATVTVKNGSIVGGASNYAIQNNGTATFEDVTATAGNVGSSMLDNSGTLTINSGNYSGGENVVKSEEDSTLLITGGTFTLGHASNGYTAVILVYGDTTITGGTFIQNGTGKWVYAQVVMTGVVDGHTAITRVKGGTFSNNSTASTCKIFHGLGKATSDNFEVSGGTFNKSISDGFCAAGFIPAKNSDGTYGVKEGAYVAEIGSTKYETLSAALAAAKKGKTVKLLADATEDVAVATSVTLDLGGKTLTNAGAGKVTLTIAEGATVTVKNGGIVGGASNYAIQNNGTATFEDVTATAGNVGSSMLDNFGTLTINSGTYVGGMNTVKNEPKATLTVNGGTFENSYGENNAHTGVIYNLGHVTITGGELMQKATEPLWAGPHVVMTDWDGSNKPSVTITGGMFTSVWKSYRATVINDAGGGTAGCTAVSGGTFNKKVPEDYCAAGFIPTANDDGTYGVKEGAYVAAIGAAKYETVDAAIAAAKDGDTVKMLADVNNADYTVANVIDVSLASGVTLDGNGKTLSGNVKVTVASAGGVTIKNVLFKDIHNAAVVSADAKEKYGFGDAKVGTLSAVYAPKLAGSLTVTGCTFENCDWEALQITPAEGAKIDIRENVFKTSASDLVTEQLRHLHIEMAYGKGFDYAGTDIAIMVTDNQFLGGAKTAAGIWWVGEASVLALSGNYYAEPDTVSITLSDGKNRTNRCDLIYPARSQADVDVDDLMASALVVHDDFNASAYSTLAEAIAAAKNGETVKLLADANGDGIRVPENAFPTGLVVDFAGHTYTVGGLLVGSSATKSNGFQLLKGNKITFKNGTLVGATATAGEGTDWTGAPAILIQNYCDLTLEKMTVKGGDETCYTLSNNNGDIVIADSTIVAGKGTKGPFAFDVCRFSTYPKVHVTVTGDSVIDGDVEVSGTVDDGQSRQLDIAGGTFKGTFSVVDKPANIAISGGTFSTAVLPDYCAAGFIPTANDDGTYGVKEGAYVAAIGEVKYETLAEAFDAAKKGDTVTLLADITLTEQVNITKALDGLTLDGNNKTITCATTTDPLQSGGSALYFGNADSKLYCTGIAIKDLTMTGTARFAIFLCGGTSTTFTNVKISGRYYIAVNLYGTHGATMTGCEISNSTTGTDKYISAIWSNVASANPLTLNNTKVDVIAINAYTTDNELEPKIYVNAGSTVDEIHTYDDGSVSGDTRLCVGGSPVMPSVKIYDKTSQTWIDAPDVVFVDALIGGGRVTLSDALLAQVTGATRFKRFTNLSKEDENGNLAWVNLVAGIDPAQKVSMTAPQNDDPTKIDVDLAAVSAAPAGTDVTVTYEIVKDGSEGAVASEVTADSLALTLDGTAGIGVYRAVLSLSQNGTEVARIGSANALGVLQTVRAAKKTIIAVPWLSLTDGNAIAVADLVKTAGLTAGDKLHVYNKAENRYDVYELTTDKVWSPKAIYKVGADGTVETASSGTPETTTVARGSGVWLERQDTTKPIVSYGAAATSTTETTLDAGRAEKPTWNLLAVPTTTAVNLAETFGTSETDKIIVPTDGAPKICTVKDGVWGYDKTVSVTDKFGNETGVRSDREAVTELPAGTGFWYLNGGAAKTVNW